MLVSAAVYVDDQQNMASASTESDWAHPLQNEWVLLANTVVRKSDIRRIDVNTQFGLICQVYLAHGPMVRVTATDPGAGWLYAQYEAAKAASAAFVLRTEAEED